ncbi:MAG: hypothetical protein H6834_16000 [Planctomycetes bacterium]|nr:hypothetical protein [Planctomycetota bacterium]
MNRKTTMLALSLIALTCGGKTLAQDKGRKQRGSGKTNTLVDVYLQNDEKVRGVVIDGRYVEKPKGIGFESAERDDRHAGIRLWYVEGTESFVFIPYGQVQSYRVVKTLSEVEVKELEAKSREDAQKRREEARERARKAAEERRLKEQEKDTLDKLEKIAKEEEARMAADSQAREHLAMLKKFSPEDNWTPERLVDIRRRIAIDLFPTAEEREFIQIYETWKASYQWWTTTGKPRFKTLEDAQEWAAKPPEVPKKNDVQGDAAKGKTGGEESKGVDPKKG